jgi:hypothetical protein
MYKTSVSNGAAYVAAMAVRCAAARSSLNSHRLVPPLLFLSLLNFPHTHPHLSCASFIAAITVVAWASFIQVESKILEKQGDNSVGSREAFRKKTTSVFAASVVLFGVSVAAFVYSFSIIGYIKPCASRHYLSPQLQQQH